MTRPMRVLKTRRADRVRSESGATAILVGLLFVALLVIASFTTDFGMAFVSKRQLQTGADAAALAAAAEYAKYPGNCTSLANNVDARADADAAADAVFVENQLVRQKNVTGAITSVQCRDGDGDGLANDELEVVFNDEATTQGFLSGEDVTTKRLAAASVAAVSSVYKGLRPYIICSEDLPPAPYPQEGFVQIDFPDEEVKVGEGDCPHPAGNWFTLDCPHNGNSDNGNPGLADNTEFGCQAPVAVVADQDHSSPQALSDSLLEGCDPQVNMDRDCLSANPGQINSELIWSAWESLVGKSIILPVFCGSPTCDPVAIFSTATPAPPSGKGPKAKPGVGDNALYPVHKFAGVKVCGWHWGSKHSGAYSSATGSADPCYGADATPGDANSRYLLLHFTNIVTSGEAGPMPCPLGDPSCDTGPRRVYLTR